MVSAIHATCADDGLNCVAAALHWTHRDHWGRRTSSACGRRSSEAERMRSRAVAPPVQCSVIIQPLACTCAQRWSARMVQPCDIMRHTTRCCICAATAATATRRTRTAGLSSRRAASLLAPAERANCSDTSEEGTHRQSRRMPTTLDSTLTLSAAVLSARPWASLLPAAAAAMRPCRPAPTRRTRRTPSTRRSSSRRCANSSTTSDG